MGDWQAAREAYHAGDFAGARDRLRDAAPEGARSPEAARYLAAAHYRLGEYADAAEVLRQARHDFPTEMDLVPQYARTLERAHQHAEARCQWEALLALDPGNPAALRGVRRLSNLRKKGAATPDSHDDRDSPIGLPTVEPCPRCGARNQSNDRRCWRCGHGLAGRRGIRPRLRLPEAWAWAPEALVLGTAFLLLGSFLALGLSRPAPQPAASSAAAARQLVSHELLGFRMGYGGALVAVWPLLLAWLSHSGKRVQRRSLRKGLAGGLFLGSAAALGLWAPLGQWPRLAFALAAVTLCMQAWTGPWRLKFLVPGWLAQVFAVAAIGAAAALSTVGWRFLVEFDAIAEYAREAAVDQAPAAPAFEGTFPLLTWVRWKSTGSEWADRRAGFAGLVVRSRGGPISRVRVLRGLETIAEETPHTASTSLRIAGLTPGSRYEIALEGPVGAAASIQVISPLPFERGQVVEAAP